MIPPKDTFSRSKGHIPPKFAEDSPRHSPIPVNCVLFFVHCYIPGRNGNCSPAGGWGERRRRVEMSGRVKANDARSAS